MSWVKRLVASRPFQKTTGVMAAEFLRLVGNPTRLVIEPEGIYERVDRDAPVIIAMWHGQHFLAPFIRRAQDRAKVLVSRHRDGEINALAAERLGIGAIRGSGHHGGGFIGKGGVSAFKEMLSALEEGYNVALTADIPKVARVAGLCIVQLSSASARPDHPLAIRAAGEYPRRVRRRAALGHSADRTHKRKGVHRVVHGGHRHLGQSR